MLGFRVWDVKRKKMLTHNRHLLTMRGALHFNLPGYVGYETNPARSKAIPMQSTGLKDWQGKEIFEGDVLFIYSENGKNFYYHVNNVTDFLVMTGTYGNLIRKISHDGNIYEQPALIEKLK